MRRLFFGLAGVTLVLAGCATPQALRDDAELHARAAQYAVSKGDYKEARREQNRAQRLYETSAVRAWLTRQPVPSPPKTPPPLPLGQY
jgi:hypothetical protein